MLILWRLCNNRIIEMYRAKFVELMMRKFWLHSTIFSYTNLKFQFWSAVCCCCCNIGHWCWEVLAWANRALTHQHHIGHRSSYESPLSPKWLLHCLIFQNWNILHVLKIAASHLLLAPYDKSQAIWNVLANVPLFLKNNWGCLKYSSRECLSLASQHQEDWKRLKPSLWEA